jgi:threonine synthase
MLDNVRCTNCHQEYPEIGVPFRCETCGGIFDYSQAFIYHPEEIPTGGNGIWRYQSAFMLDHTVPVTTLGEGNTPLIWTIFSEPGGKNVDVGLKCEHLNPTGSFKDRGSAVLASVLLSRGVEQVLEDSSGNAGASLAAYAARTGLKAKIFVPDSVSGPKEKQIEAFGAELVKIHGPRSNASRAVREYADRFLATDHTIYASHAYLPFNLPGYATIAYELYEQIETIPGAILCPVGQGGLVLGIARGFQALRQAALIPREPVLIGVQARACAPLWALTTYGAAGLSMVSESETLADGIRVLTPLRGDVVVQTIQELGGFFVAVDEKDIRTAWNALARRGFFVEPTSAVVWAALPSVLERVEKPIVAILTGSGFKFRE